MPSLFLIAVFAASSVTLVAFAVRGLHLPPAAAGPVGRALLEFSGLWAICLLANVALGAAAIMAIRSLTPLFLSMYLVNDLSVVVVSALQGFALHAWMWSRRP